MYLCHYCEGSGRVLEGHVCPMCEGRRVLAHPPEICPRCGGTGRDHRNRRLTCPTCQQTGLSVQPVPFKSPPRKVSVDELLTALEEILGEQVKDGDVASWVHGVVAGLVVQAFDTFQNRDLTTTWLEDLLTGGGSLIIDHDGIWHERDGYGGRIILFEMEGL